MPSFPAYLLIIAFLLSAQASEHLKPKPIQQRQAIAVPSASIKNLFSLSTNLYSGSSPESDAAFAELKKLGIKTIISVDGATPDVERARKFGLRYIHLPLGYNQASASNCVRIVKAAEVSGGPVLVHCHHGMHRGPAAAALIATALNSWSTEEALEFLEKAGTSHDYAGLYEQVATFKPPANEDLIRIDSNFPAKATVSSLVEAMVRLDEHWQNLQEIRKAEYKVPPDNPDLRPLAEAVLVAELYREALRSPDIQARNPDFVNQLKSAEQEAWELQRFLKSTPADSALDRKNADELFSRVQQRCASCHKAHRN
jgi:protein tyrosine phosphatase (PTP) superfamily phosphohydrolase (DUF442 family)